MVRFMISNDEFEGLHNELRHGPVEIHVMDKEEGYTWKKVLAEIRSEPFEGSAAAELLGPYGQVMEAGQWHVKVLQEIEELAD